MLDVLVLGCGPAGLVAADTARRAGLSVRIAARKRKSELFGCQYLHRPLPGVLPGLLSEEVNYTIVGTPEGYLKKVYGDRWRGSISAEDLVGRHQAWDLRRSYEVLWNRWADFVVDGEVVSEEIPDMLNYFENPTLVLSTIPATALCLKPEEHTFQTEEIWAIGDAPARGVRCPVRTEENTVTCNGEDAPSWYRVSNVFGHTTCEWPFRKKPPYENVALVKKPLRTDCDCYPDIKRFGRYGAWEKGYLVHHVVEKVTKEIFSGVQGRMF